MIEPTDDQLLGLLATVIDYHAKMVALDSTIERGPEGSSFDDVLIAIRHAIERGWVDSCEMLLDDDGDLLLNWGPNKRGWRAIQAYRRRLGKGRGNARGEA